jgi:hypothetical protein
MEPVHPSTLRDVVRDGDGNVKAYVIEEERVDPRRPNGRLRATPTEETPHTVTYVEVVTRDGDDVVYQTYLDGMLYDWTGDGVAEWAQPYGFVPLVVIPHLDVGMEWGWSELQPGLAKFREIDDVASKLHDQIRKSVDPMWLFGGVAEPSSLSTVSPNPTAARPTPGRNDLKALYGPIGVTADPLVAPLDVASVATRIEALVTELAQDYPELDRAAWEAGASASGASRREARKRVEMRARERRAGYDHALVRAQQMALSIGGYHGIFPGFGLDSYAAGALDHRIGDRPVFQADPADQAEIDGAFWAAAKVATEAGYPLELYLTDQGWDQARVDTYIAIKAERQATMAATLTPQPTPTDMTTPTPGGQPADEEFSNE